MTGQACLPRLFVQLLCSWISTVDHVTFPSVLNHPYVFLHCVHLTLCFPHYLQGVCTQWLFSFSSPLPVRQHCWYYSNPCEIYMVK